MHNIFFSLGVHIVRCKDINQMKVSQFKTFIFKETSFIAVTAYQNEKVSLNRYFFSIYLPSEAQALIKPVYPFVSHRFLL